MKHIANFENRGHLPGLRSKNETKVFCRNTVGTVKRQS